jgi:hypothetical protein
MVAQRLLLYWAMRNFEVRHRPVRVESKSVFEVNDSRLAIGTFNRPLLDHEARRFRRAWEMEAMPGFEDFQVDASRVSFVARAEQVTPAWEAIDRLLGTAAAEVKKAS